MKNKSSRSLKGGNVFFGIIVAFLVFYALLLLAIMIWSFISSFKGKLEFNLNMFGLPQKWLFSNYKTVIDEFYISVEEGLGTRKVYIPEMLFNSLFYAVGCTILQVFVQFITAYACARFDFKLGKLIYVIAVTCMVIPIVGANASALTLAERLNLSDSIIGMYLMKSSFIGMYFLVFYGILRAFPKDYSEAAYIDGANNYQVLFRIVLPLSLSTLFTVGILVFVQFWNDYTTPMLFMPNVPTLSYGLYYFIDLNRINAVNTTPMRLAACIMMLIPTLAIFLAFYKKLASNITVGGIKE